MGVLTIDGLGVVIIVWLQLSLSSSLGVMVVDVVSGGL